MKITSFFAVHALVLGSAAFVAWGVLGMRGSWPFSLSLDTFEAGGIGVALTAVFLLAVAWPVQLVVRESASVYTRLAAGLISGPVGVWFGLFVLSSYPIDWHWYISRAWALHVVFAGVGFCFSLSWHRRLRPNPSLQRTACGGR